MHIKKGITCYDNATSIRNINKRSDITWGLYGWRTSSIHSKVEFAWKPTIGDVTIDIQENVDMILPKLLPLIIALSIYWLLDANI